MTPQATLPEQAARLRELFRLTPAEGDVVLALAAGQTVAMHAEQRGVSLNTVRTLLKRAMVKIGCRRQSQLVAIVLGRLTPAG
ncbi:MAG: hypothetical protein IT562_02525 [Alphaproteobacteria bacterium]|nr:hypothetical protein [Alphaproteobacteria bacterium]